MDFIKNFRASTTTVRSAALERVMLSLALIFAAITFATTSAIAENIDSRRVSYEGQGSLVVVRLVIGESSAKLFLAGHQAAKLNLNGDQKLIQVTAHDLNGKAEELHFSKERGYYTLEKLPAWRTPYLLDVKAETQGRVEDIRLHVKPHQKPIMKKKLKEKR